MTTIPTPRRAAGVAPAPPAAPRRPAAPRGRAAPAGPSGIPVLDGPAPPSSLLPRISVPRNGAAGAPDPARTGALDEASPALSRVRPETPGGGAPSTNADGTSALSPGQMAIAAAMSEAELEEKVEALCKGFGVLRFHNPDSRKVREKGLPDDILIGARGVLWRELKNMKRKLTDEQEKVGDQLLEHGQDWAVWRPDALLSRRIENEIRAISGLRIKAGAA